MGLMNTHEMQEAMEVAYVTALHSPDPSTQNGAVLVRNGWMQYATVACNEFPRGVEYTDARWERPLKYDIIEHAERNSIYRAARQGIPTQGLVMVCPWAACTDCARAIIQAGIIELVTLPTPESQTNERWDGSIDIAMVMLHEAGVKVTRFPAKLDHLSKIRRNGELVTLGV